MVAENSDTFELSIIPLLTQGIGDTGENVETVTKFLKLSSSKESKNRFLRKSLSYSSNERKIY